MDKLDIESNARLLKLVSGADGHPRPSANFKCSIDCLYQAVASIEKLGYRLDTIGPSCFFVDLETLKSVVPIRTMGTRVENLYLLCLDFLDWKESREFKHGDKVEVNFGTIQNVAAVVNWVEGDRIWLKDVEPKKVEGHSCKFTQHIPNPVPIRWIKKVKEDESV